jgi:hypothetical protein
MDTSDVKGNVDGALSERNGRSVLAAIFRSGDGHYLGASPLVISGVLDLATIETIACREALCLASKFGDGDQGRLGHACCGLA